MDPRTPVLVGWGQSTNRRERLVEPLDLMEDATRRAVSGTGLEKRIDAVHVVNILSWSYPDPGALLASRLGFEPRHTLSTTVGGNTPQWLVGRACDAIANGDVDVVLITGAEALDSARQARKQGVSLDRGDRRADKHCEVIGEDRQSLGPPEFAAALVAPANVYPLYESVLAHNAGRTLDEQRTWLGDLMAPFTRVAASNAEHAWFPDEVSADELATVTDENPMISEPYVKRMNAILRVDQGASLLLAAAEVAGPPKGTWVFPWSAAELDDVFVTSQRPHLDRAPALSRAARATLEAQGIGFNDIGMFDIYSCFPSAVQIGAAALGVPLDDPRGLTVTGGLPYFGGPGSNYVTHSIATMCDRLRADAGIGLVTGVGWFMTKHAVGVYGAEPPPNGWQHPDLSDAQHRIDAEAVEVVIEAEAEATIEAFTVQHDSDGPVIAPVFARLDDGRRVVASAPDRSVAEAVSGTDAVGQSVRVRAGPERLVYDLTD